MQLDTLEEYLNRLLQSSQIKDFCPNGIQVSSDREIKKIVTGVTASQALLDSAIERQADAVLVHHGYFWKNEDPRIVGLKKNRLATLLKHDMALLAYHLPLDVHNELGNNKQLAMRLGLREISAHSELTPFGIVMQGELSQALGAQAFSDQVSAQLGRAVTLVKGGDFLVKKVALCTGGGQGYIEAAKQAGADLFLSGEISEQTTHFAREAGIHYIAAGHHATERYGVKSLGEHLAAHFSVAVEFVDIDNPA
ncbi:Nif3-like dinuclear metal center hexameric protein [Gayadomonas joobiniege]|uniref:Nif3-like dinuclear metal center hexameric protein n=1 Tax=Gayadomonas joobiniege TaxID=1234606 RepID=UPI0003619DC5|nr:Nif3-like dinuclear metal center hexameric protein [Gayadomonas joobiniege]